MGMKEGDSFAACAARLSVAFAVDGGEEPASSDLERVRSGLMTIVLAGFHTSLGGAELCEIGDEAIARLLKESRRQGRGLDQAAAWLRTTATHLAIDRLRTSHSEALDGHEPTIKDEFEARSLERLASDNQVKQGLLIAIEAGDYVDVRIVCEYLDLAYEMPGSPTTRQVAERCGYSHTTVAEALKRFGRYLK